MRFKKLSIAVAILSIGLGGCGGSGSDRDGAGTKASAVASTRVFPFRSAYDRILTAGLVADLVGIDNKPTTEQTSITTATGAVVPRTEVTQTEWTGSFSATKRVGPTINGIKTIAIDHNVALRRSKDGVMLIEPFTVFVDEVYRPVAAITLQSAVWLYIQPVGALPESAKVGDSSGTAVACYTLPPEITTLPFECWVPQNEGIFGVASHWALEPDTSDSAMLTFSFRTLEEAPVLISGPSNGGETTPVTTQYSLRIDPAGSLAGVRFTRVEGDLSITLQQR